ncbi:MAG: ATP-binding cassette domain-containing protein [Bacteroidetes bacterium]|nr:MAG: ATP-binding cassette domain-containing protein [Bacteroidota bacterium]REK67767.1 MAG: ATP-binding cassette domain-containing protein [Bacteroidota bacterium]
MIRAENVTKQYGPKVALGGINLNIPKGSIYGLLGPNGAGKTSFIRIMNQITAPDSGTVYFGNRELAPNDIARIGYLPEERGLYKKMKVGEQVLYLAKLKGLSAAEAKSRAKEWFVRLEMESFWEKKVEDLSKGMAQKVQFVTTVLHKPELLIFDEPFTGFDPINTNLIKKEIKRLNQEGATVIFSTHRMESVEEICDHIGLINNGEVMVEGPLLDIRKHYMNGTYAFTTKDEQGFEGKDVLERDHVHTGYTATIKANEYPSGLIQELASKNQLLGFEEVLPSVSDVFIDIVQNGPKPKDS